MKKSLLHTSLALICFTVLCMLILPARLMAQTADTSKVTIHFVNMESITVIKTDSGDFNRLTGNVILTQGTDTLYCDSALQNNTTKNFEAFSNVRIAQAGGTHGTSDYLKYTSQQKEAFMSGNVQMTDGKNKLDCSELTYNLGTKMALYDKGGKLHNDSTTVTSRWGEYNIPMKEAHFKGNVVILDTQYKIKSEDLKYNTETKVTTFYAHSIVTRDSGKSILETSDGWYDGKLGVAHFKGYSSVWNDGDYIQSDSVLSYDKQTGYGLAISKFGSRVLSIDTGRHSTMYCGRAEYYRKQRKLWATIKPVLQQVNGKDTFYIRADTFYSAPMVRSRKADTLTTLPDSNHIANDKFRPRKYPSQFPIPKDATQLLKSNDSLSGIAYDLPMPTPSTKYRVPLSKDDTGDVAPKKHIQSPKQHKEEKKKKRKKSRNTDTAPTFAAATDTTTADTTAPIYFIGYHHVLIFSDSLQGKCDSVCYTRADSLIRMMYNPIVWSHKSQITGDTILLQLDSNSIRKMYVPNNAITISQSGPEKAHLWDQVQGRTLTAYFDSNAIKKIIVKPDAQSIYFSKDDKGAYLGMSQTTSIWLFIHFQNQKITKIKLSPDGHLTMTPLEKADLPNAKLSKFKWLEDQRPRTKEELFR